MRALLLTIGLCGLFAPAHAQPLEIIGYSGYLGEWELTATVTETAPGGKGYSGPFTMKHVGLCTQEGPEEVKYAFTYPANSWTRSYRSPGFRAVMVEDYRTPITGP